MSSRTRPPDRRTPRQDLALAGAVMFGIAPLAAGFVRIGQAAGDRRVFWMAVVATLFTAGVLAAAIGAPRSRHTARRQAVVVFVSVTLLASGMGYLLGATSAAGLLTIAMMMGLVLAISSLLVNYARRP